MRRRYLLLALIPAAAFLLSLAISGELDLSRNPFAGGFADNEEFHDGDLVVSGGTYLIDNKDFRIKGSILVKTAGRLVVRNSKLRFEQDYNTQYGLKACTWDIAGGPCSSEVVFDNVRLFTGGKWMYVNYGGNTAVYMDHVNSWNNNGPWHSSAENVSFTINNSLIGLTPGGNTLVSAENSNLFIELYLANTTGVFRLPQGQAEAFDIGARNEDGTVRIRVRNSYFRDWGATLNRHADVTFVDSSMTIGLNAGSDWSGNTSPVVRVSGLKNGLYEDFSLGFDTNRLHLLNTKVRDWYPQGRSNATVEISGSDLADLNYNGETATIVVRNSTAAIAIGRDNVTYLFYDSNIKGDVSATANSRIFLYNTKVGGKMDEVGNGRIFVDGKRFASPQGI